MLAQFSVENYMCFKNRTVLNLTASETDDTHIDNYYKFQKNSCLKSVVIYGANASGKSCLLKAMTAAILMIRESQIKQVNEKLPRIMPFAFDIESSAKPSAFEFIFYIDSTEYVYGFSATTDKIIDEYLYYYKSAKRSMIFERQDTYNYKFNKADEKEFSEYREKNTDNKLFLATATAWNCEKTRPAFMWFAEKAETFTDNTGALPDTVQELLDDKTAELHTFTVNLLKNADINIDDYTVKSEKQKISIPLGNNPDNRYERISYDILYLHIMPDNTRYELNFQLESLGTQNLFNLSPLLYDTLKHGKTLFLDEMSCLHTALVRYIAGLFCDPYVNKTNAQLIFVTHDTNLLDLNVFRRDQIYFVDKDKYGVSELYSLTDFSVRKKENIRLAYLIGRFGAVPSIKDGDLF